jgi:REP element-mobilizing transposase RayT
MAGDKLISEIVKEGMTFAQQSYNMKHEDPIEVKTINFNSHSVELVVACPLNVSAATISQQFKGASSSFIGKNYEQYFKNENSPVFVSKKSFWSRGKFYVLSSTPIKEITQIEFYLYKRLKNMWENIKTEDDPNEKGKILEQFAENMFELMNDFEILRGENGNYDINLGFEQIDLTLKNKSDDLKRWGNFIKVECKNHAKPVGNDIIRDFSGKLRGNIRLGILISANGFGKFDEKLLVRLLANDKKLIVRISGHEIEDWLNKILTSFINIDEKKNNKLYNIEYMFQEKINRAEFELI